MLDAVPLTEELLRTMRTAAKKAIELHEASISTRALLLALLDEPDIGPVLSELVDREKVRAAQSSESSCTDDTLSFKTPDGRASMRLGRDAYAIFIAGAQRVEERYLPKHLALGLAAQVTQSALVLKAMGVEPGALRDALYKL